MTFPGRDFLRHGPDDVQPDVPRGEAGRAKLHAAKAAQMASATPSGFG